MSSEEDAQLQGGVCPATVFAQYFQLTTFKHLLSQGEKYRPAFEFESHK